MRRCPSCQTIYTDPEQKFCLNDGTQLVDERTSDFDPQATLVASGPPSSPAQSAPTQSSLPGQQSHGGSQWAPPPPPQYAPPPAQKKSKLPWIIGGLVLAVVGLVIVGVVGFIILLASIDGSNSNQAANKSNANLATRNSNQTATESRSNASNSAVTNGYDSGAASSQFGDEDEVLEQLTAVEQDWNRANFTADRKTLERILADEYQDVGSDGSKRNKADYLKNLEPWDDVESWQLQDLKLNLNGGTAVLSGVLVLKRTGGKEKYTFTDTFVWRDGRWQAIAAEAAPA